MKAPKFEHASIITNIAAVNLVLYAYFFIGSNNTDICVRLRKRSIWFHLRK